MSDFRCPYYYWDGNWKCRKSTNHTCTSYEFDTYCTDARKCSDCPYYNK